MSMPSVLARCWMLGSGSTSLMPLTSVSMTGLGVPAGTGMPFQLTTS